MNVLVTGGAGFIGSHIVDALVARGDTVRVIDNLLTGSREYVNTAAEFVEGDVCDQETIRRATQDVELVFHCAALPRVQLSIDDPLATHRANVDGVLNVLVAARDARVRRVIYSASSSAYGLQPILPLHEDLPLLPSNPYALQKYIGEQYARLFTSLYGLATVSLRYFNVYGPRMSVEGAYATVIGAFLRQKKAGEPLTIAGDGTQTRDFTHVDDVVLANLLAADASGLGQGEVINVGSGERHSINEIAALFGGSTVTIAPRPAGSEAHDTLADIARARTLLGWEPKVAFSDGLRELLTLQEA